VCSRRRAGTVIFFLNSAFENRDTGGFILIDRFTNNTIGAGLIHFALLRSQNIHWQGIDVDKRAHAALKGHRPRVVWFTALSGADKSSMRRSRSRNRVTRSGELVNFTGIDSPHELPERHEVTIDTTKCRLETAAEMLVTQLRRIRVLGPPFVGGA
jgi:hypothetical protein